MINLDRLRVFHHVFSEKGVISAAKRLNVSQSAVSQALQKLEREIKSPLFTRLHRKLIPTNAGKNLFGIVGPFMEQLDIYVKDIDRAKDQPFGELRIGLPVVFGNTFFPGIIAAFRTLYPDVTFHLKFGDPGVLLPMVENGQLDIALVDEFLVQNKFPGTTNIFHYEPVVEEEIILACSKQYYDESIKGDHSFQNLVKQDFIIYRKDAQTIKTWFRHHFGRCSKDLHFVLTVDSHQFVISSISHHLGMGIVASHMVKKEINSGQIIHINTSNSVIINQIILVHLLDKIPTITEKVFSNFLATNINSISSKLG